MAGTARIHILGAGYLVAFGYFMLQGSHLLLQPVKITVRPRDCLVAYSALLIAVKTFLSVGACVYLETLLISHGWLVHSFSLDCTVPGYQLAVPEDEACDPQKRKRGSWDAMCLTFLLIQRRIFLSYYHLYVVPLDDVTVALRALSGDSTPVSEALRGERHGWWRAVIQVWTVVAGRGVQGFATCVQNSRRGLGAPVGQPLGDPSLSPETQGRAVLCDLQPLALFLHRSTVKSPSPLPLLSPSGPALRSLLPGTVLAFPGNLLPLFLPGTYSLLPTEGWTGRTLQIYHSIHQFFSNLRRPPASRERNVYTFAFLVEMLNLAVVLFGYWAFGWKESAADLAESLLEETVPKAFLAMGLIQFGTMLGDRALYPRKALLGKCAFQVLGVLRTHFWPFFILPGVTSRRFNLNHVAQIWYLVKCIDFGPSAYQIRCGYPNQILGNFLTKHFNLINLILFKGFRLVPFLLELRVVIDWVWTDNALNLSNWICLEDVYANIFIMKCYQESEKKYPRPLGRQQKKAMKYRVGCIAMLALVFLMWFPLVFMALLKTVGGVTNQPLDVSVKIAINSYKTLFSMSAQQLMESGCCVSCTAHSHGSWDVDRLAFFRNATVRLQQLRPAEALTASPAAEWQGVQEWRPGCDQSRGCGQDMELVIFHDKVSPRSLDFLAGYGLVGLYVSVVMVVAKFTHEHFPGIARSIMYDQLPDVVCVLGLCAAVFPVRELGKLQLEQKLLARLNFLYRSPETTIKWTQRRPPAPNHPVAGAPEGPWEAAVRSSGPLASRSRVFASALGPPDAKPLQLLPS
ncbi:piezo-type mechanosensitive ion channel component 2-like [Orcinus orca]|uniref:piezo-type mechanosensitive ion channel component 2-like n=1 Tax=Orcinus orca TaxID=9733 RepID=UPI0021120D7B|nr:piezo-type mechanosensitive ion channel component 2-like [Orcinus orca]